MEPMAATPLRSHSGAGCGGFLQPHHNTGPVRARAPVHARAEEGSAVVEVGDREHGGVLEEPGGLEALGKA